MKPDKFDEAIRRKLEGIQPGFQEEDWGKFKAYQSTQSPTSFIQRYGRSMMYTAASVAAAVMVFANVYQYRQKQHLNQEITQLKGKLSQKDNAPIRTSNRVDTVYITKYISVEPSSQPNAYAQSVPSSTEINTDELKNEIPNEVSESLRNAGKIIRQNSNERIGEATERQPSESELSVSGEKENNTTSVEALNDKLPVGSSTAKEKNNSSSLKKERIGKNSPKTSASSLSKQKGSSMDRNEVSRAERVVPNSEANEVVTGNGSVTVNGNPPAAPGASSEIALLEPKQTLSELDGLEPANAQVQRYAYATLSASATNNAPTETKATPPPPSISFKNVKFRMGAGFNIGDKFTGYTFNTSLLLGKYWSVDVGIGQAKINGPQYYTDAVFKAKNNRDFQTWKKSGTPQPPLLPPQAFDITTSVSLVRMPVSLTYRWPLNNSLTLLMSGGTNLNLSAIQEYCFSYRERNGELEVEKGKFDVKPALSNDFMFSAGIEKQWKSIVFQTEVYAAPYLQKPAYLTENRNIGVRFKLLYQFGKTRI
jgi:hypothetical protein